MRRSNARHLPRDRRFPAAPFLPIVYFRDALSGFAPEGGRAAQFRTPGPLFPLFESRDYSRPGSRPNPTPRRPPLSLSHHPFSFPREMRVTTTTTTTTTGLAGVLQAIRLRGGARVRRAGRTREGLLRGRPGRRRRRPAQRRSESGTRIGEVPGRLRRRRGLPGACCVVLETVVFPLFSRRRRAARPSECDRSRRSEDAGATYGTARLSCKSSRSSSLVQCERQSQRDPRPTESGRRMSRNERFGASRT